MSLAGRNYRSKSIRDFTLSSVFPTASGSGYIPLVLLHEMKTNIPTEIRGKIKKADILRGRSSLGSVNELFIF